MKTWTTSAVLTIVATFILLRTPQLAFGQRLRQILSRRRDYCYSQDNDPYVFYGTKTHYGFIPRNDIAFAEGCSVEKLWVLSRHGTRYPEKEMIIEMKSSLPVLQAKILNFYNSELGNMCPDDMKLLSSWSIGAMNETWDDMLAPQGANELFEFGRRIRETFPGFLPEHFSNVTVKIRHTPPQRTTASAESFAKGLYGPEEVNNVYMPPPPEKDYILSFYKLCSKFDREVGNNPAAFIEEMKFKVGWIMRKVIITIAKRIGFPVTFDEIKTMYEACRFDSSWDPRQKSPWCSVFVPFTLKVMEYWEDIYRYYRDGYGHRINYLQACPPIADLLSHFKNETNHTEKAAFYFSHSSSLLKMISRLGMLKDRLPMTHNFINQNRMWRTSFIDPFAANIMAVLSNCNNKRLVTFLVNEKVIEIPGCSDSFGSCDFETFLKQYEALLPCNFDKICENNVASLVQEQL